MKLPFKRRESPPMDCIAGRTEVGIARGENQDALIITSCTQPVCAAIVGVADGLGSAPGGKRSSEHIKLSLEKLFKEKGAWPNFTYILSDAIRRTNAYLLNVSENDEKLTGMGATLTCAYIREEDVFLYHSGDCRAYAIRGDKLVKLTKDHTMAGISEKEDAGDSLLNLIGGSMHGLQIDTRKMKLQDGDILLICSDGFYQYVGDEDVVKTLEDEGTAEEYASRLINLAMSKDPRENVTIALYKCEEGKRTRH